MPETRVKKALESIATYYPDIDLSHIPITFSSDISSLGRYYYKQADSLLDRLLKSIPTLRAYTNQQRIVLSTAVLDDPELSYEFRGIDAVEIVLHHEILHYLIDIHYIECTDNNHEIWIDNTLKDHYRNKNKDKYNSGLPVVESKKLDALIEKFNSDDGYRRKIMQIGNSRIVTGDSSRIHTAEEYLATMAMRSKY